MVHPNEKIAIFYQIGKWNKEDNKTEGDLKDRGVNQFTLKLPETAKLYLDQLKLHNWVVSNEGKNISRVS